VFFCPPSTPTVPKRKGIAPVAKTKDAAEGSSAKDTTTTAAAAAPSKKPAAPKKDKEPKEAKEKAPPAPKVPKASSSFMIFSNEVRPRVRGEGRGVGGRATCIQGASALAAAPAAETAKRVSHSRQLVCLLAGRLAGCSAAQAAAEQSPLRRTPVLPAVLHPPDTCCWPAEENPGLGLGEVGKKLGAMWREMSAEDKKVYEVRPRQPPCCLETTLPANLVF
jgi:hypothetical protein